MRKKTQQHWSVGDVFLVPLKDTATSVVAQVVGQEPEVLNSVTCAFFDLRVENDDAQLWRTLQSDQVFAVMFCTRDLLDLGHWRVVGRVPVEIDRRFYPYENLRAAGWIGAKVRGSGVVNRFLNAFYGLDCWDDYWKGDASYFDRLLVAPAKRPAKLLLRAQ